MDISGPAVEGEVLTASNTLADDDGLGVLSYQWQADGADITGATSPTLALAQDQVGKVITVVASYTDQQGTPESVGSAPTAAVANVNDLPTGSVDISGPAVEGEVLTASNTLADDDGLGVLSYQWQADGADIAGATSTTLALAQDQVGKVITVVASYTDQQGTPESVGSAPTAAVANINDLPTGSVDINGTAADDQILTASNTLADDDGLGMLSYQWQADGADIAGATSTTLALAQDQVGKVITVVASYTDQQGTPESVGSAPTAAVANVNDLPTGSVDISGPAVEGEVLTASNTLADDDGLGVLSYQWQADGTDIAGATSTTLALAQDQVGKVITVVASYTDQQGTPESVGSAPTGDITPANFRILNTTTSGTTTAAGDVYAGPVGGLQHQYASITTDSLNITSFAPNAFIHGGSGMDGIDVTHANGDNILDGGDGSNFLTGGTGNDTFYMDNRSLPSSPVFSTIVNFHAGDNATIWGVNATDFAMLKLDNEGAVGFTGLDFIFSAQGHMDTSFVLAGYTSSDLTNGRLSQSFGTTPDLPSIPGSQYMTIHAN